MITVLPPCRDGLIFAFARAMYSTIMTAIPSIPPELCSPQASGTHPRQRGARIPRRLALTVALWVGLMWAASAGTARPFGGGGELPVRITSFTATYNAVRQLVSLHWVTAMERNNENFIIERSLDSLHFVVIGKARSVGNSQVSQHYYFDDTNPGGGKMFYRLREIDSSGKQYLTTVVSAFKPVTKLEVTNIRASADGKQLSFAVISPGKSSADIVIADISGHVVKSFYMTLKEGGNLHSIYTADLGPGIYFLQVNDREGNGSAMGKFTQNGALR